ncbi:uncharacterized protein MONOS_8271 [Monocercomonoides exilis]|uniref:uncharacterized protein n=1 Tax=Monocercomonoides exilis TaxID=2049356 RepID=UPI003559D61C|nr:hypothetical protein MONOS_8271 [Monocercomonoides exilis]|eukprot:MONOS_8271.1-p1 / transcript=MONOS_8271.1 / gene=MONOS_8271 / organism=Monocercomonoides_exilis_PA203 / gene_product=unspecified product / transcript_product=unspecified product / location=Mono_scaffold00308:4778-5884(+) / protein_length=368 / sequence_SO=supercontig / SO=protein_coding / is_pseudo=false
MIESLHDHTTTSDGLLTHEEFLLEAQKRNFSVVAFTDHDAVPSPEVVEKLRNPKWSKEFPVKYVWGIEMTGSPPAELGISVSTFHIVGLFIDPLNKELSEYCKTAQERRIKRMKFIVGKLNDNGFIISEDDCLKASGGESVGRPHIVTALSSHPENEEVMKKIISNFVEAREKDSTLFQQFPTFDSQSFWSKSYQLFLSKDAWMKGVYMDIPTPDLRECSRLIHGAGGIVILAHYFTIANKISVDEVEKWLKEGILDGAETIYDLGYPPSQPSTSSSSSSSSSSESSSAASAESEEIKKRKAGRDAIKAACERNHKIWWVGGGDIHTLEGMTNYAQSPVASQTAGMTAALVKELGDRIDLNKSSSLAS